MQSGTTAPNITATNPKFPNLQVASRLFHLPPEIRCSIYLHLINRSGVHIIRAQKDKVCLSPCVGPDIGAGHVGYERRTTGDFTADAVWGRRLVSSWGPHWQCEEIALKTATRSGEAECEAAWRSNVALLRVCKKMRLEVIEVMTALVCFNITDLATLGEPSGTPHPAQQFSLENLILPRITKLDITLRLPLPFFEALAGLSAADKPPSIPSIQEHLGIWCRISSYLARLKSLRRLRIWLDHSAQAYWSVVNERAVLSPLTQLAGNPCLDLSFDLPKLHPKLEDPGRHYIAGEEGVVEGANLSVLPLKIRRRLRQRYYGELNRIGSYRVSYAADFPHCLGHPSYENMSLAEMEKWEGPMWRAGVNVKQILSFITIE